MNHNEDQKQNELNQAGTNTAHVAGKTAATVAGSAVGGVVGANVANKLYDKVSDTKLGQGIEQGVGKIIGNTPIVNQVNKKANDIGAVDAAGKVANLAAGKGLKGAKPRKRNMASASSRNNNSKLKNPTGNLRPNQANNSSAPQALQNKGNKNHQLRNQFLSSEGSSQENQSTEGSEDDYQDEINEEENTSLLDGNSKGTLKALLKLMPILLPLILVLGLILVLVIFISSIVSMAFPAAGLFGSDEYVSSDPTLQAAQDNFEQAIQDIISEYQAKYGVTLDKSLLFSTIVYRYLGSNEDDMFSSSGSEDISDEELNNRLENLGDVDSEGNINSSNIDYSEASKKIEIVASLMVTNEGGTYSVDFSLNGDYYNTLLNSNFLVTYYKDLLKDTTIESKQKLVNEIFDYAEFLKEFFDEETKNTVLGDSIVVYLQTCHPTYNTKTLNGMTIYDNPSVSEGTSYPDHLVMTDYIKGVISGEIGGYIKEEYREGLKAFAITALTYLIGDSRAGYDLQMDEMYMPAGNCRQLSCDPNIGCTYTYNGHTYGTSYTGMNRFGLTSGVHKPLNDTQNALLDGILSEIFGDIMVKKGVTSTTFTGSDDAAPASYLASCSRNDCLSQKEAMQLAKDGMTYLQILDKYYDSTTFDIINIKEGLYVENVEFSDSEYNGNVIFYDQNDYKQNFCGRSDGTISTSGCGVVASAIVTSTFMQSNAYDPVYMMNLASSGKYCGYGISGTNASFFASFAKRFGFGYERVEKSSTAGSKAVSALRQGNALVIAHMGAGTFTNGGHYIVLSAVNSEGMVYVHDPNNRMNEKYRGSGNGWYDIQLIVRELKEGSGSFYIITKG